MLSVRRRRRTSKDNNNRRKDMLVLFRDKILKKVDIMRQRVTIELQFQKMCFLCNEDNLS